MAEHNQILWSLDNEIQPRDFERLCVDLLGREGYHHIEPGGGIKDKGRDAEIRFWNGASDQRSVVAFQFSLEKEWERKRKLFNDAKKIADSCPKVVEMIFVTSQKVTGAKKDKLREEFKSKFGWELTIYDREWLRHRLSEFHQDLAKKYLGLDMPPTVCHAITQLELSGFDEDSIKDIFKSISPELARASLLESTRREPFMVTNWHKLAQTDYVFRNYDGALEAINKALELGSQDKVLMLNMGLFKGAILAEKGIRDHARPLLIQAKEIFSDAVKRIKRAVDHYNLANTLVALGEISEAGKHYERCVALEPENAKFWTNSGNFFIKRRRPDWGIDCFDKALKINPNLVEAHLSKATALMIFIQNGSADAIQCFEAGYKIAPDLDKKWKYVRYWYSRALMAAGRGEEALRQIELEIALRPGDSYLLNQKASVLRKLWRQNPVYQNPALEFFRFRAHALPNDYAGLAELIEIYKQLGTPDEAWSFIEANLDCKAFPLRQIATQAEISLGDFQSGFQNARLYKMFRQKFSVEDHCITLQSYGLSPSSVMLPVLNHVLIAPFGAVASAFRAAHENKTTPDFQAVFQSNLKTMTRLFPIFGVHWLARTKPQEVDEQIQLLSTGIIYLADVVVAETARQIGFIAGRFGLSNPLEGQNQNWKEVRTKTGILLLEKVLTDWQIDNSKR